MGGRVVFCLVGGSLPPVFIEKAPHEVRKLWDVSLEGNETGTKVWSRSFELLDWPVLALARHETVAILGASIFPSVVGGPPIISPTTK